MKAILFRDIISWSRRSWTS